MLILFDIDMTLLSTSGAGMKSLEDAGRDLFGAAFDATRTDYGGRLDPLIIHDLLVNNRIDPTIDHVAQMRAGYRDHLADRLGREPALALEGALELVKAVGNRDGITTGLLTGNFEETGALKLESAGFSLASFALNVWGDDSPHVPPARDHLPLVAIDRFAQEIGGTIEPERVVVIGDTIHDVGCALANGCRVLGVATGHATVQELERAGAHRVVADLSQTSSIVDWIMS